MISVLFAVKGGSGTTVLAACHGVLATAPTLLVDLDGDAPGALGLAEPDGPGVLDWLRSGADASRLARLEFGATATLSVLPRGAPGPVPPERWPMLAAALVAEARDVIVDAGTAPPPPSLTSVADRTLLVTRGCYLAVRAAARARLDPTGIVLLHEPGRSLGARQIEDAIGAPVVATVLVDPGIARAVDAGLISSRLPTGLRRALRAA